MNELLWLVGISSLFFAMLYYNRPFMVLSRYISPAKSQAYRVDENSNGFDAEYHHVYRNEYHGDNY